MERALSSCGRCPVSQSGNEISQRNRIAYQVSGIVKNATLLSFPCHGSLDPVLIIRRMIILELIKKTVQKVKKRKAKRREREHFF